MTQTLPPEVTAALDQAEAQLPIEAHGPFLTAFQTVLGAIPGLSKAMKSAPAPTEEEEPEDDADLDNEEPQDAPGADEGEDEGEPQASEDEDDDLSKSQRRQAYDVGAWLQDLAKSMHDRLDDIQAESAHRLDALDSKIEQIAHSGNTSALTEEVQALRGELGDVQKSFSGFLETAGQKLAEQEAALAEQGELNKSMQAEVTGLRRAPVPTPRLAPNAGAVPNAALAKSMAEGVPQFAQNAPASDERFGLKEWEFQMGLSSANAQGVEGADLESISKAWNMPADQRAPEIYKIACAALGKPFTAEEA